MIVYRLSRKQYARDLSGKGAELAGGRWNSRGNALLYTSQSVALCMVEIAVHTPFGILPENYELVSIEVSSSSVLKFNTENLPRNWRSLPWQSATQKIGDDFLSDGKYLMLQVPSAVVEQEFNYLINPAHPEFNRVAVLSVASFSFDKRLFAK